MSRPEPQRLGGQGCESFCRQVNPADLYTALMGGRYGPDQRDPPFAAGHDGIGVVVKVTAAIPLTRWAAPPALCGHRCMVRDASPALPVTCGSWELTLRLEESESFNATNLEWGHCVVNLYLACIDYVSVFPRWGPA